MTAESVAVYDKTYKKYPNVFRLVCPKGHQYLFQAENESEMNDWVTKINYAATFKSIGLKMRHVKISSLSSPTSSDRKKNQHPPYLRSLNKDDGANDAHSRANVLRVPIVISIIINLLYL